MKNKVHTPQQKTEEELQNSSMQALDAVAHAKVEQELSLSEIRLQLAIDALQMGTYIWYPVENRSQPDKRFLKLLGLNISQHFGHLIYLKEFIHPDDRSYYTELVEAAIDPNGDGKLHAEFRVIHKDKSLHWLAVTGQTVFEGKPLHADVMHGMAWDITEKKLAESILRKAEDEEARLRQVEEQQFEIVRATLNGIEEERKRIADSLHNGLGQLLYGIKISLSALSLNMEHSKFEAEKSYTNYLLSDAIVESRRLSHELMPLVLEEFGLKAALDDICEQFKDIYFNCRVKGYRKRLEKYLELAVYRSVQELTINVVKHAKATRVDILVSFSAKQVTIMVNDNGIGIGLSAEKTNGIGLKSLRAKIILLHGQMDMQSDKSGTRIKITIPIPKTTGKTSIL